jgi:formamidopyrimidine-DNA glycosylase
VPELPDLTVYLEHLEARTRGATLDGMRFASPFVLRSVSPPVEELLGREVLGWRRLAKQLVLALEGEYFVVIHLMIAGRLQWQEGRSKPVPKRNGLVAFDFSTGTVLFTEASKKKRASVRLVEGNDALLELDPGGLEVFEVDRDTFAHRIRETNHTLKRALTDQHVFAGIGNAYSDEILLRAQLSPFKRPASLSEGEMDKLFTACRSVLEEWVERLRAKSGDGFPKKVTAFHPEMAVHGRYREACPVCGAPVQRIRYAENESNYCARCQTDGRVLADRSLSRLLKDNWPKRIEDLE